MVTEKQREELQRLKIELKKRALPVGSLHSFWDIIFDIESVLNNQPAIISDPEKLIKYSKEALSR